MGVPSSVKIKNDGVEYLNNVDRVNYTIEELTRAALKDVAKLICKRARQQLPKRTGRMKRGLQYWVRKRECDLQVGFKPSAWYGMYQEFGSSKQPKFGILTNTVEENIDEIRKIEGQYLSAIENENAALGLIDEAEVISNDED